MQVKLFSNPNKLAMLVFFASVILLICNPVFASAGAGGGLPYEGPLMNLKDSITGPFAFVVSIIGIVVAGSTLIFGGELSGFVKSLLFLVLVVSVIVSANSMMSTLFSKGATIASLTPTPIVKTIEG